MLRQQLQGRSIINCIIVSQYVCSWTVQCADENFRLKHMSQHVPTLQVSDAGAESDLRLTMTSPQPGELVKAQLSMKQHFLRSCTKDQGYKAAGILGFAVVAGAPVALLGAELTRTGLKGKIYRTMYECRASAMAEHTTHRQCELHASAC